MHQSLQEVPPEKRRSLSVGVGCQLVRNLGQLLELPEIGRVIIADEFVELFCRQRMIIRALISVTTRAFHYIEWSIVECPELDASFHLKLFPHFFCENEARTLHDVRTDVRNAIDLSPNRENNFRGFVYLKSGTDDVQGRVATVCKDSMRRIELLASP